jgi:hypothetical protein
MEKLTENELAIARLILNDENNEITSSYVRFLLGIPNRIVLTKGNFPNIRHLLYSYMTAYSYGMFRGGFKWVCVISIKSGKKDDLQTIVNNQ